MISFRGGMGNRTTTSDNETSFYVSNSVFIPLMWFDVALFKHWLPNFL
jgi:hypothetical protein